MQGIQVLKGPQSLFFGKNSPAGVVEFVSTNPVPGEAPSGYVRGSWGFAQDDAIGEGAVSFPVGDTVAMRLALRVQNMSGGYVKNQGVPVPANQSGLPVPGRNFDAYPGTEQVVGRVTTVWKPSGAFDLNFKLLYSDRSDNSANGSTVLINCEDGAHPNYNNLLTGQMVLDTYVDCSKRQTVGNRLPDRILGGFPRAPSDGKYYSTAEQSLFSVVWNYRFGALTLSSNTGYYDLTGGQFDNFDMDSFTETPVLQEEKTKTWTQELRLASSFGGPLNFTVGGFFERERRNYWQEARIFTFEVIPGLENGYPVPGPFLGYTSDYINDDHNRTTTYSAFGQLSWKVLDSVELTAGGRYTKAKKSSDIGQTFQYFDIIAPNVPSFTPAGNVYFVRKKYDNFSPEATLSWKPTDDVLLYVAYKTGFLAGGIQNSGIIPNYTAAQGFTQQEYTDLLSYDPEKARGFEVGMKGIFFDGRLNADLTVFDYDLKKVQIATYHVDTTSFTVGNAASAIHRGAELNLALQATDSLQLTAYYGYYFNKFDRYDNAPCFAGQTLGQGCVAGTQDLSGRRFSSGPWELRGGFRYNAPMTERFGIGFSADVSHVAEAYEINGQPGTATEAHTLLNAALRFYPNEGPWEIAVIGSNLTDEFYASNIFGKPLGKPQDIIGVMNPGREVRLQVNYGF
jgi:iron complex outermembrane recepter protein